MSADAYRALRAALREAGCFTYRPARAVVASVAHLAVAAVLFALSSRAPWPLAAPLFAAGSYTFCRLGFLMHDALHGATFGSPTADLKFGRLLAAILGTFPSGWSYGHNRHHAHPNVRGIDDDQPHRWDEGRRYESRLRAALHVLYCVQIKGRPIPRTLFLLILRDGIYTRRFRPHRFWPELVSALAGQAGQIAFFSTVFGPVGFALYLLNAHLGMLFINLIFAGSHYELPTFSPDEARAVDFAALQVVTTCNYRGGRLTRLLCGGIEHQIEHHLFPTLPRRSFHRAAPFVRAFCARRGLTYREEPFWTRIGRLLDFHVQPPGAGRSTRRREFDEPARQSPG